MTNQGIRSPGDGANSREQKDAYLNIQIDQQEFNVHPGKSVAAALIACGRRAFRRTDQGDPRGLFCGMGVCYECLVEINGRPDQRACMTLVEQGMHVRTRKAER